MKKVLTPLEQFHSEKYLHLTRKTLEHMDSLDIDFEGKTILEVGAGVGDHTQHLLSRGCAQILASDARTENLRILRERFEAERTVKGGYLNLEVPQEVGRFDVCYCYGVLYHLSNPGAALRFLAERTRECLLLGTCVAYPDNDRINPVKEDRGSFSQSISGVGCRPGRIWIFKQLQELFEFVYMPKTQPDHEQYPTDWMQTENPVRLKRAIFVGSRKRLADDLFLEKIPMLQENLREWTLAQREGV